LASLKRNAWWRSVLGIIEHSLKEKYQPEDQEILPC
jgi:hypothetical protein